MLTIYKLDQSEKWDEVVKSFSQYDVYWLSGYVKAFEINGDGEPILFYLENNETRAINVAMKRDVALDEHFLNSLPRNKYFDISTPYGYGGWLVEGNMDENTFAEYRNWCINNGIICEFMRFHPVLNNYENVSDIYDTIYLGNTVFIDTTSEEIIWRNITSKNRNVIRKAQKSGVVINWYKDEKKIPVFMEIYNATMQKDNASDYYFFSKEFYDSIYKDLYDNSILACAEFEGKIIANAIFMYCNGQMHYHLSASRREYQNLAPSNLMIYEAALWGNQHGLKTLHLGGGVGSHKDNLYKFKKAFNRDEDKNFYIGRIVFDESKYEELLDIRKKESDFNVETIFFPKYRG